jgi:hypothetical protein
MRKWIILGGIVAVAALAWLTWYGLFVFHLTSTFPENGSKTMPTYQEIDFHFNQNLSRDASTNTIVITQGKLTVGISGITQVNGKEVSFIPNSPLAQNQAYTATLSNITNASGRLLAPVTISFTATYVPLSQLPSAIEKRYVSRQDQNYDAQTPLNKLLAALPHPTTAYTITYISVNSTFVVQVNSSDITGDEAAALAYIKSFGVDPASITISYSIPAVYSGQGD